MRAHRRADRFGLPISQIGYPGAAVISVAPWYEGMKHLALRFRHALKVMPALLLAVSCAKAVECANDVLNGGPVMVCRVNLGREKLQLFWRDDTGRPYQRFDLLRDALARQGKTLEFAMNGGMYQPDFSPVGLFVSDGRELVPLNRHRGSGNFSQQPNGVFLLDSEGARVLTTDEYWQQKPQPLLATQSGPMLVHEGAITTSAVMGAHSQSRRIRNGVCAPAPGEAVFVITGTAVTFHEFAEFFLGRLHCGEALYLDGSISSVYAPQLGRADRWSNMGPIVGVVR
jgi:uncharacterized protein YigE (DUF2233 family)